MRRILNLGCGDKFPVLGEGDVLVNHDRLKHRPEVDVVWDLDNLPWPWPDESFDFLVACAVLEHLRITLVESLAECWRILGPGGLLHLKVPYWHHENAYADPTHYWHFSLQTFNFFDPQTKLGRQYGFYRDRRPWKIVKPARLNEAGSSIIATLQVRK